MKQLISMIIVISILLTVVHADILAAGGSIETLYEEGMKYFEQEKYDHAFSYFQISGEVKGYALAQNMLGICYRDGLGTEQNMEEAEKFFRLSADQGYVPAQENLAVIENSKKEETEDKKKSEHTDYIPVSVGDYITFGSYEQDNNITNGPEPIEWLVLDVQDGEALLLSKYALISKPFEENKNGITWETSSLRTWLKGEFFNDAFTDDEKTSIIRGEVSAEKNPKYGTSSGSNTKDSVFLLSISEAEKYFRDNAERLCQITEVGRENIWSDNNCWWWLRTSGKSTSNAAVVNIQGAILNSGDAIHKNGGVRPAVCVEVGSQSKTRTNDVTFFSENERMDKNNLPGDLSVENVLINNENLTVIVNGKNLLVTVKGLEIEDQYIVNKDNSLVGLTEYGWQVRFNDTKNSYRVQTIGGLDRQGANNIQTIDQMDHKFYIGSKSKEIKMQHTNESITWNVDLSGIGEIYFDKIEEFTVSVIEDGYGNSKKYAVEPDKSEEVQKKGKYIDLSVGDYITFGTYEQDNDLTNGKEPIEWLVLDVQEDKVLLISRYGLDYQKYYEEYTNITWEGSSLRKWLNREFLEDAFTLEEKNIINSTIVPADENPDYDTDPGNKTTDKLFVLSAKEAYEYFTSDEERACEATTFAEMARTRRNGTGTKDMVTKTFSWWLRTPGISQNRVAGVDSSGKIDSSGSHMIDIFRYLGVRPSLWIKLNT